MNQRDLIDVGLYIAYTLHDNTAEAVCNKYDRPFR